MSHIGRLAPFLPQLASPLTLSHCLLALAEDVDRAGQRAAAEHLIELAHDVLDLAPAALRLVDERRRRTASA